MTGPQTLSLGESAATDRAGRVGPRCPGGPRGVRVVLLGVVVVVALVTGAAGVHRLPGDARVGSRSSAWWPSG